MSDNKLPEPNYYSLAMLSKKWNCSIEDILHYGRASGLPICVVSEGWHLEEGYYDDGFPVPTKKRYSYNELLPLHLTVIRDVIKKGEYTNPFFYAEGDAYLQLDYRYDQEEPDASSLEAIRITIGDLMIRREDAFKFKENSVQNYAINSYTTPYIELMKLAIAEHNITEDNQGKVILLKEWFLKQSVGSFQISDNEAKSLATFVRLPSSKKGGNKKYK